MPVIYHSRTITTVVAVATVGFVACEAFAPQQTSVRTMDATSRSQDSLLSRNAFFGLFGTDEKTAETSADSGGKASVFDAFSLSNSNALIEKTKDIVDNKSGFYSDFDADVFAEDFVFRGPYVGPLNKKDYLGTMEYFSLYKSIPDIKSNAFGYSIDPNNPNRVWFICRNTGTFSGEPLLPGLLNIQPNYKALKGCPETFSAVYDKEQKLKYLSVGYVADRFDGNTDGLAAAFGIFKTAGLSLPTPGGPLLRVIEWISSEVLDTYPRSYSTDLPAWYTEEKGKLKASEGCK